MDDYKKVYDLKLQAVAHLLLTIEAGRRLNLELEDPILEESLGPLVVDLEGNISTTDGDGHVPSDRLRIALQLASSLERASLDAGPDIEGLLGEVCCHEVKDEALGRARRVLEINNEELLRTMASRDVGRLDETRLQEGQLVCAVPNVSKSQTPKPPAVVTVFRERGGDGHSWYIYVQIDNRKHPSFSAYAVEDHPVLAARWALQREQSDG